VLPPAVLLTLALIALVTAGVAAVIVRQADDEGGGPRSALVPANTVAILHAQTGELVGSIPVELGANPSAIAYGEGYVWAYDAQDKVLYRIDPRTRDVSRQGLAEQPTDVTTGGGSAWVAFGFAGTFAEIAPNEFSIASPVRIPGPERGDEALALAHAGDWLWMAGGYAGALSRIDPSTGKGSVISSEQAFEIAAEGSNVWVSESFDAITLWRYSASSGTRLAQETIGSSGDDGAHPGEGGDMTATSSGVWFANTTRDHVIRVDPATTSVAAVIRVGNAPTGIAADPAGSVWVANSAGGSVSMIDPAEDRVVKTIRLGHAPTAVAVGGGYVWVTVQEG
jgi:YVTN family beta-propeller protein